MTNRNAPFSPHEHLFDVRACAPRTDLCKTFLRLAAHRRWEVNGARTLKPLVGVKPEPPVSSLER
ncbi:hypothetical protein [Chelativorans sp. M5D2P16]|uniref:hypothetical protein n=1 Tax=Chelativorans sp. M5D2P16 TaxID=3095678 RepID=UPI002ACA519B|nr:hypothetical protein [Chelativorans sp. M5D2P16]MDZ5697318.1 hypothetical protein [Chelativorans sp. M5D2P16]